MDTEHAEGILRDVAARSSYPYTTTGPAAAGVLAELDTARARIAELEPAVRALLKDLAHREQGDPPYDPALVDAVLAALARKD